MAEITIFIGTVFGTAEQVTESLKSELVSKNHKVTTLTSATVNDITDSKNIIICTSTTGSGDIPEELAVLFYELEEKFPLLTDKTFAVIGLGDSSYGETFCGAGKKFDELLGELTAKRLTEFFCIDAMETFTPETDAISWLDSYLKQLNQLKLEE